MPPAVVWEQQMPLLLPLPLPLQLLQSLPTRGLMRVWRLQWRCLHQWQQP